MHADNEHKGKLPSGANDAARPHRRPLGCEPVAGEPPAEGEESVAATLRELLGRQLLAVLATQHQGAPYGNLVAFWASDDLAHLVFATTRATRKFANLLAERRVALVIDSRRNRVTDFHDAIAVTATGTCHEALDTDRERLATLYLDKHPQLTDFVASPTCALVIVEVDTYYLVSRFQHVVELHVRT
jgi:nitroimidazol reductase NimA-like FMN-containing flavoprotein (pyridoxamine 5'-phosphate oxidase superfamily)